MNNKPTIPVYFKWLSVEADPRPYKPAKPILEPVSLLVEVKVPITNEYMSNAEIILNNQITNQQAIQPILTPKGMKYCSNELEIAMSTNDTEDEDKPADESDWSEDADDFVEET